MDIVQITCTLSDVPSFLGVYPSDLLPGVVHRTGTLIINADPHTKEGLHWFANIWNPDCTALPILIPMAVLL